MVYGEKMGDAQRTAWTAVNAAGALAMVTFGVEAGPDSWLRLLYFVLAAANLAMILLLHSQRLR